MLSSCRKAHQWCRTELKCSLDVTSSLDTVCSVRTKTLVVRAKVELHFSLQTPTDVRMQTEPNCHRQVCCHFSHSQLVVLSFLVTVLAQLCFNIVFYYSMLLWNDCSYLATKLLKSELQLHRETCASCWLWTLTDTAIVNMSTLVLHT